MVEHLTHLYGCGDADLDAIASRLRALLSLLLEARDSSYWGAYYCDKSRRFTELRLYANFDPMFLPGSDPPEERWFEPEDRDCATLLYLDATADIVKAFDESLAGRFPEFTLLKTSTYMRD
jgi:hypothetical protein